MTRIVRDALSAIVLMCVLVTAPVAQSPVARPQARPTTPAQPPVTDPDQEVETIGTPEDDELQQLIAQAEALAAEESPASDEAIALISEELDALKAGLELKASLLEAGEDTTEADMEIAARSESLQAAIDATTEPDSSDEPAPIAHAPSPERGKLATHIDAYVGEALGILTKIQELLAIHRDDAAGTESSNQGDADPSEETLQDVTGVITESGEPVAGVRVTDPESGADAVTDADGQYTLHGLPAGRSAHLVLSKSGTQVGDGQLDLRAGRDGVGDFDLKRCGCCRTPRWFAARRPGPPRKAPSAERCATRTDGRFPVRWSVWARSRGPEPTRAVSTSS
jgi:Carboxypeptidase regulatory-like domain